MAIHRFKPGNQMAKLKGKHTLSKTLFKHNDDLLKVMIKKAKDGDMKALTWFLDRSYGKAPVNPIALQGGESAEQLLEILKANLDKLPVEIVESVSKLINTQVEVKEVVEIEARLTEIENPKKKKKKKKKKKVKKAAQ